MEYAIIIVTTVIISAIAVCMFFISYRQHKEKGFIFTNVWLYASAKERENMDERIKKAEYRVGRNIFFMTGVLLSISAIALNLRTGWLSWVGWSAVMIFAVILGIYGVVQHVTGTRLRARIEAEGGHNGQTNKTI